MEFSPQDPIYCKLASDQNIHVEEHEVHATEFRSIVIDRLDECKECGVGLDSGKNIDCAANIFTILLIDIAKPIFSITIKQTRFSRRVPKTVCVPAQNVMEKIKFIKKCCITTTRHPDKGRLILYQTKKLYKKCSSEILNERKYKEHAKPSELLFSTKLYFPRAGLRSSYYPYINREIRVIP